MGSVSKGSQTQWLPQTVRASAIPDATNSEKVKRRLILARPVTDTRPRIVARVCAE